MLDRILQNFTELPLLFSASAINELENRAVAHIIPKIIVELEEERGLALIRARIQLYLLQNDNEAAAQLSNILYEVFPAYRKLSDAVRISFINGQIDRARSQLNEYLSENSQQSAEDFALSSYLVARIFMAEGNTEASFELLSEYFSELQEESVKSPYTIANACILQGIVEDGGYSYTGNEDFEEALSYIIRAAQYPDHRLVNAQLSESFCSLSRPLE